MIRESRTWGITTMLVVLALAVTPAFAQPCALLDSGDARPQFMLDRMPECGGTAPAIPPVTEGANSLTTLFASDNGGAPTGGIYFDLEVVGMDDVTVNSWDTNLDATFTGDVSVWFRTGTFSGAETSPAGWTLVGTDVGVSSAGNDVPTPIDVGPLDLTAGTITGIAISLTPTAGATGHIYTNGTGGNQTYNDGVLELRAGSANNTAFSSAIFTPRVWNGTVYYDVASAASDIPTLGEFGLIALLLGLAAAGLAILRRP